MSGKRSTTRARVPGWVLTLVAGVGLSLGPAHVWAQDSGAAGGQEASSSDLAKKLNNPVSDLVSVPFQFNWAQPVGPDDATRFILNIQPVMPFGISEDWNMITRVILPVVGQPALVPGGLPASGLSDVLASFFFSPKSTEPFIWGVGPVFSIPSTSEPTLGTGRWSAGPTGVILKQSGGFTYGVLANQVWSFAGSTGRADVSQLFVQPFLSYTTPSAVSYVINSETTANWKAENGQKWTVPINLMLTKVASFGPFPAAYQAGVGFYLDKPDGGPDWQLRAAITLLLPRKH